LLYSSFILERFEKVEGLSTLGVIKTTLISHRKFIAIQFVLV